MLFELIAGFHITKCNILANKEFIMSLKEGMTVGIYVDPITKDGYEGEARLIRRRNENSGLEQWAVEFEDVKGSFFNRWIRK